MSHYTHAITPLREAIKECADLLRKDPDVRARWFAGKLVTFADVTRDAWQGCCEHKDEVDQFRLAEIAAERKNLSEQDAALEAEARTLTTEKPNA
jgi:hypothetical protein